MPLGTWILRDIKYLVILSYFTYFTLHNPYSSNMSLGTSILRDIKHLVILSYFTYIKFDIT